MVEETKDWLIHPEKYLKNEDGSQRTLLELNCSAIKNNDDFFDQIFIPLILDNEISIHLLYLLYIYYCLIVLY